ncbi:MAG TPA: clostripain-related cysteine peptidase [Longimicrobiales bacterium]|nr:clostripain-related cysteine peptidase [Longimicrobiales bacterium]
MMAPRRHPPFAILFLLAALACGGESPSDPGSGDKPDVTPATISVQAGGGETVRVGSPVAAAPAVVVRNAAGSALSGVGVTFAVEAGGGSVTGASAVTDASGVARVGSWTVGATAGENRLRASVTANSGLSTTISATARLPRWTVMVYMAADNNLAVSGIFDIDELEAAGTNPEVQVLVQAEFNPTQLSLQGCTASCFNRPNFNTFRYRLTGAQPSVTGPNGAATDIGNRDMTSPAQLTEFVSWAKQTAPAERYILVLWNHGGGYTGLLQDETSAGSALMTLSGLRTALSSVGTIDIIDFDMCLMAGYETLYSIRDVAKYAVFSEEVVPGDGNPYDTWLAAVHSRTASDPSAVAVALVDAFDASYQGQRASTTRSAYSLSAYADFETSLNALADVLRTNITALRPAVGGALANAQKYEVPELTDFVTFLDSLRARTTDATVRTAIDAAKTRAADGQFRLRNRARNGTDVNFQGGNNVARSTGLHVVLPSGVGNDRFASSGPRSFSAYQALFPGRPWTTFLQTWVSSGTTTAYTDQGSAPFQGYLVWDTASVRLKADVDLWILEPSGDLYIPWLGTVTPNGTLTGDSSDKGTWYEGYLTNRYVQNGRYRLYAQLYADPSDHRPLYDVQYRYGPSGQLKSLYAPNYRTLSLQTSWLDDPNPTFAKVESGAYTDLKYAAYLDIGGASQALMAPEAAAAPGAASEQVHEVPSASITPQQLERVRRALAGRRGATPGPSLRSSGAPTGLLEVRR